MNELDKHSSFHLHPLVVIDEKPKATPAVQNGLTTVDYNHSAGIMCEVHFDRFSVVAEGAWKK